VGPAARLACAELLLSGTTTCCDGYFLESRVADALAAIGIRGVLAQGVIDFPAPGVPDPSQNVANAAAYVDAWKDRHAAIRPSIFCHSPYTCSAATLRDAKSAAAKAGVLFQVHVAETRSEREESISRHGVSPVRYLADLGVLDTDTLCVHGIWVDEDDRRILSDTGAAVVHCPHSNMKLASGVAPVPDYLESGMPVALGTDGAASNNTLDMIREMGTAARLHKAIRLDPTVTSARQVLEMATMGGARAVGMAERIGSIEPGKLADLVVIDTRRPHLSPIYEPVSHVVYAAAGADVQHVLVGGRFLVRDRQLTTIDIESAMADVSAIAAKIRSSTA
jgi:5-methylthioadenosine/S-adenosylhomocysteine deaminase